jgi:prepilin-type N-terminal cleavage/methylation domain-containing protein
MKIPFTRHRRAFTLVEIMIVVAIVGILSLLAVAAITRIRDRAIRSTIQNNLRQLYQAKVFYFAESGTIQPVTVNELHRQGYLRPSTRDALLNTHSFEVNAGWNYTTLVVPDEPTSAYRGASLPNSAPAAADAIFYPGPPKDASTYYAATRPLTPSASMPQATPGLRPTGAPKVVGAAAPPTPPPAIAGVRLMPRITGATVLSANAQQAKGVAIGNQLVGLYMAGSDVNQLAGTAMDQRPRVATGYTNVGSSGYQYFEQSGQMGRLMPTMADNLRPLAPSQRNAWDGGIAVFADGSVARLEKVCNGNGAEKDYAYFSVISGVNANQGMAMISGTAEPGQTVRVEGGGAVVGTVTADAQGRWTMAGPAALAGNPAGLVVTSPHP